MFDFALQTVYLLYHHNKANNFLQLSKGSTVISLNFFQPTREKHDKLDMLFLRSKRFESRSICSLSSIILKRTVGDGD